MATIGPFDFSKGYSPGYELGAAPPGFATNMMNCRVRSGSVIPRFAQTQTNATTLGSGHYVTGMATWIDPNFSSQPTALIATCNGKIYTTNISAYTPDTAALTFDDRTGATTIATNDNFRYTFDSLGGILLIAGNSVGGVAPLKITNYTSNAAALGGSPPKADCVKVVNNFAFLGRQLNATSTYSTINWSNVGDPETWGVGNALDVNKQDGEPIMALGSINSDLYIFKQTSIWRLSTVTQTISGSVTLGPLQLVIRGVGCIGPLALDNLPNGNIVFVGFDGHFYEFDGTSTFDLSYQPYPGPNAYNSSNAVLNTGVFYGIDIGVLGASAVSVKTWKGLGEVWIAFDYTVYVNVPSTANTFCYDFINKTFQGYITGATPKCFASFQMSTFTNSFEANDILFHGNSNGLVMAHGSSLKKYPVDEAGTAVSFTFSQSVRLAAQSSEFVPRSVCFELPLSAVSLSTFVTTAALDSYSGSTISTLSGASAYRVVANIPMKQDAVGSNILPNIVNLSWSGSGTGTSAKLPMCFGKFYLSDEIIR